MGKQLGDAARASPRSSSSSNMGSYRREEKWRTYVACQSTLSRSSLAGPSGRKTSPGLSSTIIRARLGDRGSHHVATAQCSSFPRFEPQARCQVRPRCIAAPRGTRAGDGGGAVRAATSLHRALRLRSRCAVAVAGEVAWQPADAGQRRYRAADSSSSRNSRGRSAPPDARAAGRRWRPGRE
jgi:hypothetical protein